VGFLSSGPARTITTWRFFWSTHSFLHGSPWHSRLGRAWIAIPRRSFRRNPGHKIDRLKLLAFTVGAGLAAWPACLMASKHRFISPAGFGFTSRSSSSAWSSWAVSETSPGSCWSRYSLHRSGNSPRVQRFPDDHRGPRHDHLMIFRPKESWEGKEEDDLGAPGKAEIGNPFLDGLLKSLKRRISVIPGASRNPGFPVKTGIKSLRRFRLSSGRCLDPVSTGVTTCYEFIILDLLHQEEICPADISRVRISQRYSEESRLCKMSALKSFKGDFGPDRPNGAGKTTLFNCLTGIYPPTREKSSWKFQAESGRLRPAEVAKLGIAALFKTAAFSPG